MQPTPHRNFALMASVAVIVVLIGALAYSYVTLSGEVTNKDSAISGLTNQLSSANSTILQNNGQIKSLQDQTSSLNSTSSVYAARIVLLQGQLSANASKVQSLQTQISQDQTTIGNLNNQISQDKTQISNLQSQITSLQSANQQVSSLQSQVAQLQAQVTTLNNQVTTLNSQINALSSQLAQYQAVFLYGLFAYTTNCGFFSNCSYAITGPYANFGGNTASSATVTFLFYSASGHTGQVLCQTSVVLGNVGGRTLTTLPQATCSSSSMSQAQSWTWMFNSS